MKKVNWDEVGPELLIELRQAVIQMEMASDCIEKGRSDEALLHVNSLMRQKRAVISKAESINE